jgi:hypothetical protein
MGVVKECNSDGEEVGISENDNQSDKIIRRVEISEK